MSDINLVCTSSCLYIREKPSSTSTKLGSMVKGAKTVYKGVVAAGSDGIAWYKHTYKNKITGYSIANFLEFENEEDMSVLMQTTAQVESASSTSSRTVSSSSSVTTTTTTEEGTTTDEDSIIGQTIEGTYSLDYTFSVNSFKCVLGLPYQFMAIADPRIYSDDSKDESDRLNDSRYGMMYAEKILSYCPILFIAPGKAEFMGSYNTSDKVNVLSALVSNLDTSDTTIADLLDGSNTGRYYTFSYDRDSYYKFVNPMLRQAAIYLGIGDRSYSYANTTKKLKNMDWSDLNTQCMTGLMPSVTNTGEYMSVPFYLDGETSISESFSNDSTTSQMASTVNGISDTAREINYLLGYSTTATGLDSLGLDVESSIESLTSTISGLLEGNSFLSKLAGHLSTVATGGKLIFPKIWESSNFNRSYSVSFKFISPDCDPYSIYLNILVPLFHLICFAAPHSANNDPNAYTNPFIVRAMYRGFFNIDLGLVTGLSITKGGENQWTPDGIPTSISVSMDIEDLYDVMSITDTSASDLSYTTVNNTALMDYIATWCGIELFKPEIGRLINMWVTNKTGAITDIPTNIWSSINTKIANKIMNVYRGV